MKTLPFLLLLAFCSGCRFNGYDLRSKFVIMNETRIDSSCMCYFNNFNGTIYFKDSCKAYDVGDTVIFEIKKQKP